AGSRGAAGRGVRHPVHQRSEPARCRAMTRPSRGLVILSAALVVALWGASCRGASPEVRVGSKKFTESVVLGEVITQVLRSTGTRAEHRAQLGGTQVLWHALLAGEIDLYPEYTGTIREDIVRETTPDG